LVLAGTFLYLVVSLFSIDSLRHFPLFGGVTYWFCIGLSDTFLHLVVSCIGLLWLSNHFPLFGSDYSVLDWVVSVYISYICYLDYQCV
jgi:hypothetical protein